MSEKTFPIVLEDGKTRQLKLDWPEFCEIERRLGESIIEIGKDMREGRFGFWKLHVIIWAGLFYENKELSIDALSSLLDPGKFLTYTKIVGNALSASLPAIAKEKDEEKAN
jgi:hypothetical protein